jgi:hypothetical protein
VNKIITRSLIFGFVVVFALGTSQSLVALTAAPLTLDEMVASADLIIQGTCVAKESAKEGPFIFTYYTIAVSSVWKGLKTTQEVTLRLAGGSFAGESARVNGIPDISLHEEMVLFLRQALTKEHQSPLLVGGEQGKITISPATPRQDRSVLLPQNPKARRVSLAQFQRLIDAYQTPAR